MTDACMQQLSLAPCAATLVLGWEGTINMACRRHGYLLQQGGIVMTTEKHDAIMMTMMN